jgi:hypothetical protein
MTRYVNKEAYSFVHGVGINLVLHEELELAVQLKHKVGPGGDRITIKEVRGILPLRLKLFLHHQGVLGSAETAGSLLVHLCAGSDTVHR